VPGGVCRPALWTHRPKSRRMRARWNDFDREESGANAELSWAGTTLTGRYNGKRAAANKPELRIRNPQLNPNPGEGDGAGPGGN
jgi:hypothetical protein